MTIKLSKTCTCCREHKPMTAFFKRRTARDGRQSWCTTCAARAVVKNVSNKAKQGLCRTCTRPRAPGNRSWCNKHLEQHRKHSNTTARRLKLSVFNAYGGARCACCAETHLEFLTIDHVRRDGAQHRRVLAMQGSGGKFYKWLKTNKYPPGFRVLCMNCNASLGWFGYCPHAKAV